MRTVTTDMQLEIGDLLMVVNENVNMNGITHKGQVVHVSAVYSQSTESWEGLKTKEIIKINANRYGWTIQNFATNFALLEYHEKELYSVLFE